MNKPVQINPIYYKYWHFLFLTGVVYLTACIINYNNLRIPIIINNNHY